MRSQPQSMQQSMAFGSDMSPRIERLKVEIERLEGVAEDCHPAIQGELQSLIEDMRAHLSELSHLSEQENAHEAEHTSR